MYFAIYQALAEDERRPGLFRTIAPDFFDLIIVDECHRGSARDESTWRDILDYFEPAYQLGMTATPLRDDNRDTYLYFGNPIYTYSLRQGIEDGFLAPYRVHRVVTDWDAAGWRPSQDELDRYGRAIPDDEYQTKDFERVVALRARTEAIARHLTDFLKKTDRFAKTIVFCVDQEHAERDARGAEQPERRPRGAASRLRLPRHLRRGRHRPRPSRAASRTWNEDAGHPHHLAAAHDRRRCADLQERRAGSRRRLHDRVQADHRARHARARRLRQALLQHPRLHRLRHPHVRRPDFDGDPTRITEEEIDEDGETTTTTETAPTRTTTRRWTADPSVIEPPTGEPRKFYFDGGQVEIVAHLVHELDPNGKQLRVVRYTDYAAESVRTLCPTAQRPARRAGPTPTSAARSSQALDERGIDFEELAEQASQPDADPFDLLCHLAFNAPLRTRRERAQRLQARTQGLLRQYSPEARQILDELLEKYAEHGDAQFVLPDVLQVPPISAHGQPGEIIKLFGGPEQLREAVNELQGTALCRVAKKKNGADAAPLTTAQRSAACSSPRATSCARTRGSTATSTGCRCSPGSCSSSSSTTWSMQREEEAKLAGKKFQRRHRAALPLARLGRQSAGHHRRRTARLHQSTTRRRGPTASAGPGLFAYLRSALELQRRQPPRRDRHRVSRASTTA